MGPTGLEAFTAPGKFYRGNLHTHSTLSDGVLSPEDVCRRYAAEGYDFISLTDHLVGIHNYPIASTEAYRTETFTTILGAEMHTGQLGNGEIWHMVAVGLPQDFERPVAPDFDSTKAPESAASLAQRCRDAGAFVVIAHPQWFNMTLDDARRIEAAHAVEIYNHGCEIECTRGDGTAILDQLLSEGRRLTGCATDDAHFKGPDHFGGWVMVKSESLAPDALLEALKAGAYYSSQGPRIHGVRLIDDHVEVSCSPATRIAALGYRARARFTYGSCMSLERLPLAPFVDGGWLRVVIADAFGRKAWSNPIWLD